MVNKILICLNKTGNSSSRVEAMTAIETLLSQRIQLFCFDFSGKFSNQ
jgi:hypothetical protein